MNVCSSVVVPKVGAVGTFGVLNTSQNAWFACAQDFLTESNNMPLGQGGIKNLFPDWQM